MSSPEMFQNMRANMSNLVHFLRPVQQKMYNSVFNLDFERSNVMTSGDQKWHGKSTLLKVAQNLLSLPYSFCDP